MKVIGWRIFSFIVGSIISYLYLGELRSSINLIAILTVVLTICHYNKLDGRSTPGTAIIKQDQVAYTFEELIKMIDNILKDHVSFS